MEVSIPPPISGSSSEAWASDTAGMGLRARELPAEGHTDAGARLAPSRGQHSRALCGPTRASLSGAQGRMEGRVHNQEESFKGRKRRWLKLNQAS